MNPTIKPDRQPRTPGRLGWVVRYGLAVAVVAAAMGLRLALTAWVGPGLTPYITFYPAVMVVALLAGFGPGSVATAVAGFVVVYWIIPPIGQFSVETPLDRLGLGIFTAMGLFMSLVAEFYRRSREKAAAYDREAALRESQEILRRQAELIDPVRAEIIAREMLSILRERGSARTTPAEPAGESARRVSAVAGAVVAVVGLLVMAGWVLELESLKTVLPGFATMKANTALCFFLAGVALVLRERRAVRLACAGLVCAVAGLTLAEYITGGNFGLDQFLFRDIEDQHTIYPGRMAEATAMGFLLSSVSLLLLKARVRAALRAQQALAAGAAIIGAMAVLGYFYDAQQFYRFAGYSSMALHTAALFVVLAAGLILARPDGLAAVLMTPGPGAQLTRLLLPSAILMPVVMGWLIQFGLRQGFYGEGMDIALLALLLIVALATMVLWSAHALSRGDAARRETETQLHNLADVMNHAHEPLIVRELGGVIHVWNSGAEALYGWPAAEALGQREQTLLGATGYPQEEINRLLESTGHWEGELIHTTRDGRRVTVESRQTASRTGSGRVFVLESILDITERKRVDEELRQSEERYRALATASSDVVYRMSPDWSEMRQLRGRGFLADTEKPSPNWLLEYIHPDDQSHVKAVINEAIRTKSIFELEHRVLRVDGTLGWTFSRAIPMSDANGKIVEWFGAASDVSERKQAEEQVKASLAEKEVMLREIHHRVKNNLQVISSLVSLQADGSTDETVREVLKDVTYRVRSMALVHEKLYQSESLSRIDFAEYVRGLFSYLWRAYGAAAATVRLNLDLEPVSLPMDIALPCGLILNELASNALKHAFRGRNEGEVIVSLQGNTDGLVSISVRDNGVGLPAGLDWRHARSLGLRLVQMLAGQLNATVEVDRSGGTEFTVCFRLKAED